MVLVSHNQVVGQYVAKNHNGVDAKEIVGTGSTVTEHKIPLELDNDDFFDLPAASTGWAFFLIGDAEEYGQLTWASDGTVTLINASAGFKNTDTGPGSGDFCVFDNGTTVRCTNRTGAAVWVAFDYHYYTM